jgi:hypothetical protein
MRKFILAGVVVIFSLSAAFLVTGIIKKRQTQIELAGKISKLPAFSFTTLAKQSFNSSEITSGPVLVVRFHPECEHCQYEIREILGSPIPVSAMWVIMVSDADADSIKKMLLPYDLAEYPSVIPLTDTSYSFGEIFGSDLVPSSYIYDKDLELVKVLYGEVKTETILKYLNESEQDK